MPQYDSHKWDRRTERLAGMLLVLYWIIAMAGCVAFGVVLAYLFLLGLGALVGV
jgi:hypothetical protein